MSVRCVSLLCVFTRLQYMLADIPSTALMQYGQEKAILTFENVFCDCSPAFVKRIIVEELGVALHDNVSGAEVRSEAMRFVLKCSEEVACECIEKRS